MRHFMRILSHAKSRFTQKVVPSYGLRLFNQLPNIGYAGLLDIWLLLLKFDTREEAEEALAE